LKPSRVTEPDFDPQPIRGNSRAIILGAKAFRSASTSATYGGGDAQIKQRYGRWPAVTKVRGCQLGCQSAKTPFVENEKL
jgi:hypothetical protein